MESLILVDPTNVALVSSIQAQTRLFDKMASEGFKQKLTKFLVDDIKGNLVDTNDEGDEEI